MSKLDKHQTLNHSEDLEQYPEAALQALGTSLLDEFVRYYSMGQHLHPLHEVHSLYG